MLGVDLAGVPHRPTGMCRLEGYTAHTFLAFSDKEILDYALGFQPHLTPIDAPLHLPPGRKSLEEKNGEHFRLCDLELRKRRIPFFPITLGPMRKLTERGIRLSDELEKAGLRAVEIYPGGSQDVWGLPRAKKSPEELRKGLSRLGLRGLKKGLSDHELDAASGALTGILFLLGEAEVLGDFESGAIVLPKAE